MSSISASSRVAWHGRIPAILILFFLYLPIAVVVLYSFNAARYGVEWKGFTLDWYRRLSQNDQALRAIKNTFLVAGASTVTATLLGTMLGFALARYDFPAKQRLNQLMTLPIFIPDIVLAVALLLFYATVRTWISAFELSLFTMILAHVTFQLPFVALVVRARLAGLDPALEEAARDLGARPGQTFRHVTLPLLLPGIVAGALLAFTLSLDDFVVSFFTGGPGTSTIPILIYGSVKRGITPEINALSSLIVFVSMAATVVLMVLNRSRRYRSQ